MNPVEIRKQLREKRKALSEIEQNNNSQQAFEHFKSFIEQQTSKNEAMNIALFLSQDGELDTQQCIEYLWQTENHQVFLPVLETHEDLHMAFVAYTPQSIMKNNQFGILEPDEPHKHHLTGEKMDLVFMPLVGFDSEGNRLGMGGGYYDRSFSFKINQANQKPLLIGWAHSCQQVDKLPKEPWDVPLNGIITEDGLTFW